MKKNLRVILMAALMALPACTFAGNENSVYHQATITVGNTSGAPSKKYVQGDMPCDKSNTVYSQGVDLSVAGTKGVVKSDQSYVPYTYQGNTRYTRSRAYAAFTNNQRPVTGIRVYATAMNTSWSVSTAAQYNEVKQRLNLDDDENMTKPLRLGVIFCKDDNGYPGEVVYKKEMDVLGVKSEGTLGDESKGEILIPFYCFDIPLGEEVRMQNGWVSVYCCDTGEHQSTFFCIVSDSTPKGKEISLLEYEGESGEVPFASGAAYNFCLTGDPTKSLASKGLKFMRVLGPDVTERSKYAKVQVEVWNYGSQSVNDATFSLVQDGKTLATEKCTDEILPNAYYKYTFQKRIDCSSTGTHSFTVQNATAGDEGFADKTISFSTTNTGDKGCDSRSNYNGKYKYIKKVTCGDINNESDWSLYSDFTAQSTDIAPGQTVTLTTSVQAAYGDYVKVWVDWNGDGSFDGEGEMVGYASSKALDITIPTTTEVKPGKRTMRIILSDNVSQNPCGIYDYGETEDYTLNVLPAENAPSMSVDAKELVYDADINTDPAKQVKIANGGTQPLDVNYEVMYSLPLLPNTTPVYRSPKLDQPLKLSVAPAKADASRAALATNDDPFVLTYGGEYNATAGAQYQTMRFAHYYPAAALQAIKGMKISSIDVYLIETAKNSSKVSIWKADPQAQNMTSQLLYSQEFTPVANGWNHIQFNEPFVITGDEGIFVGLTLDGCSETTYQVGIDHGPANVGFGDLFTVNDYNQWWSFADSGVDANLLIRANVTGARTPAVNWLHLDKKADTVAAGAEGTLTATADAWNIDNLVYDAAIRIKSNDPMAQSLKIPVYLDNSEGIINDVKFIDATSADNGLSLTNGRITINTDKHVAYIALYTTDGRQIAMNFDTNYVDTTNLLRGIYAVKAVLADGTEVNGTVAVK